MLTLLRVPVDSPTLQRLQAQADASRKDLEEIAQRQLRQAAEHLPVGGRAVVVSDTVLTQLEEILGGGSLLNQGDLLEKVSHLAGLSFFHVRLPFSPQQLALLAEKADREGTTVERLVERAAPRVYEQFFDLLARV